MCISHHVKFKYVHLKSRKSFTNHIVSTTVLQVPIILNVSVGIYAAQTFDLIIALISTLSVDAIFRSQEL